MCGMTPPPAMVALINESSWIFLLKFVFKDCPPLHRHELPNANVLASLFLPSNPLKHCRPIPKLPQSNTPKWRPNRQLLSRRRGHCLLFVFSESDEYVLINYEIEEIFSFCWKLLPDWELETCSGTSRDDFLKIKIFYIFETFF